MKNSSYSKKVFNYLNENKFDLSSLLLEEEEEKESSEEADDLFGDEEKESDSSDDSSSESESDDSSDEESSDDKDDQEESESESADLEDVKKQAEDQAAKEKAETILNQQAAATNQGFGSELDNIQDRLISVTNESYQPYYSKKGSIKSFMFEADEEEDSRAFEMLKDIESQTTSVPMIVKNSIEYIRHFDSKVNKAQLIYDIAVKGIIETGGKDFQKELDEFDELFHQTFVKEFPDEQSPVRKTIKNQNYHTAAGAKSQA